MNSDDKLQVPGIDPGDLADNIVVHAVECIRCNKHSEVGDEEQAYRWQGTHYDETDHVTFWHYKLERSRARIVHPAKGHW
jgi:hypothetical protein